MATTMGAKVLFHNVLQRPAQSDAQELEVASGPRPEALLALLLIALLLMSGPAVVAGLLMVDSNFLDGARDWFQGPASWLSYLAQGRVILLLPLVGMVARAKEDL
ncbi:MAG TPA: hypothetical protein VGA41_04685 [Candidatus Dormibacteraeota bacterium]